MQILGAVIRVLVGLVMFVGIYYFLMTRWQGLKPEEALKQGLKLGIFWVIIYEIIIHFFA